MTKKRISNVDFSKVAANVIKTPLETFVEDSYLPYAHYVIMNRALISDDGLKPVQRRILYAMDQLGLTDKKDHMKAAQIVGETMGKYHPHGDSSIGDALARMGQTFSMRVPLIDVQGSVGFTTGDDPAAPRYWEGRPTAAAMELTRELSEGAVEMGLNYDGKFPEPAMLPVKWPNGLINGSQGIAVGYSSNVIPHNPTEVMDGVIALVKNPKLTIEEVMKIIKGPDMATGGILIGYDGVEEYYRTGKGSFSIRGTYTIEPGARGTHVVTFDEAPYQTSAEQVVTAIENSKKRDRLKEVSYVKDLSDIDNGFKLSIGIKAGANPEVVMKDIFKWTPLEQSFSANMNVLKDGVPKVNSMIDLLQDFIDFRSECIINKTKNKVDKLTMQIERLNGIIAVLIDIDKAINIIRKSDNDNVAKEKLQKHFKITEDQADYILTMPLRRLTKSDSVNIQNQVQELNKEYEYLNKILNNDNAFKKHMIKELEETKAVIADPRRTRISNKTEDELKAEIEAIKKTAALENKNAECYITLFADDTITRTEDIYKQDRSPTPILSQMKVKTKETLIFITRNGEALKLPAAYVPQDTIIDVSITTGLLPGTVVGVGKEDFDDESHGILLVTTNGGVNIVSGGFPTPDNFTIVKLDENEEVFAAHWITKPINEDNNIVMVSSDAYVLHFPLNQVRTSNSGAGTVRGMNMNPDEHLAGVSLVSSEIDTMLVSCTHTAIKTTEIKSIPERNRGAKGMILQKITKDDEVLTAFAAEKVIANKNGKNVSIPKSTERATVGTRRNSSDTLLGSYEFLK